MLSNIEPTLPVADRPRRDPAACSQDLHDLGTWRPAITETTRRSPHMPPIAIDLNPVGVPEPHTRGDLRRTSLLAKTTDTFRPIPSPSRR